MLAHARGSVRCSRCDTVFDALTCLFDEWPAGRAWAPATGADAQPPVLGEDPVGGGQESGETNVAEPLGAPKDRVRVALWTGALVFLAVLTVVNAAWTFREPLLEAPGVSAWLQHAGWTRAGEKGLLRAPDEIRLLSKDMHTHPTRAGILVLSMTFVNLAPEPQVFPRLQITLLDAAGQPVARRRLEPSEYLRPGVDIAKGLGSGTLLPVLIEFVDPGARASGFEIRFL